MLNDPKNILYAEILATKLYKNARQIALFSKSWFSALFRSYVNGPPGSMLASSKTENYYMRHEYSVLETNTEISSFTTDEHTKLRFNSNIHHFLRHIAIMFKILSAKYNLKHAVISALNTITLGKVRCAGVTYEYIRKHNALAVIHSDNLQNLVTRYNNRPTMFSADLQILEANKRIAPEPYFSMCFKPNAQYYESPWAGVLEFCYVVYNDYLPFGPAIHRNYINGDRSSNAYVALSKYQDIVVEADVFEVVRTACVYKANFILENPELSNCTIVNKYLISQVKVPLSAAYCIKLLETLHSSFNPTTVINFQERWIPDENFRLQHKHIQDLWFSVELENENTFVLKSFIPSAIHAKASIEIYLLEQFFKEFLVYHSRYPENNAIYLTYAPKYLKNAKNKRSQSLACSVELQTPDDAIVYSSSAQTYTFRISTFIKYFNALFNKKAYAFPTNGLSLAPYIGRLSILIDTNNNGDLLLEYKHITNNYNNRMFTKLLGFVLIGNIIIKAVNYINILNIENTVNLTHTYKKHA